METDNNNKEKKKENEDEETSRPHVFRNVSEMVVMFSQHDIRSHLVRLLSCDQCHYILGCLAWYTDFNLLDLMAQKQGVCIITQRESFNTRSLSSDRWRTMLRAKYAALKPFPWELLFQKEQAALTKQAPVQFYQKIRTETAIRIAGDRIEKKNDGTQVMMHEKYILILDAQMKIIGVWVGSYNFSKRASNSLEQVFYIADERVITVFFHDFLRNLTISECSR